MAWLGVFDQDVTRQIIISAASQLTCGQNCGRSCHAVSTVENCGKRRRMECDDFRIQYLFPDFYALSLF